jgi:hypothetical protein
MTDNEIVELRQHVAALRNEIAEIKRWIAAQSKGGFAGASVHTLAPSNTETAKVHRLGSVQMPTRNLGPVNGRS